MRVVRGQLRRTQQAFPRPLWVAGFQQHRAAVDQRGEMIRPGSGGPLQQRGRQVRPAGIVIQHAEFVIGRVVRGLRCQHFAQQGLRPLRVPLLPEPRSPAASLHGIVGLLALHARQPSGPRRPAPASPAAAVQVASYSRNRVRLMMWRCISEVPSQIRSSRASRHRRSTGSSSISPMPP